MINKEHKFLKMYNIIKAIKYFSERLYSARSNNLEEISQHSSLEESITQEAQKELKKFMDDIKYINFFLRAKQRHHFAQTRRN